MDEINQTKKDQARQEAIDGIKVAVDGIVYCLERRIQNNNGVITSDMKKSAKHIIFSGVNLTERQTKIIYPILTSDELIKMGREELNSLKN